MIVATRYLRRGLRACERAGVGLDQVSQRVALSRGQLERIRDGEFHWATLTAAEALLAALPPAVERAVREPTYATLINCRTGTIPPEMLAPAVERVIERHGIMGGSKVLGVGQRRARDILDGRSSVTFALADRLLTRAGEALAWHDDPELRRAYFSFADTSACCAIRGHRSGWKLKSKREREALAA